MVAGKLPVHPPFLPQIQHLPAEYTIPLRLISFFHNLTDRAVGDIIDHFQTNQFISNCLHGPAGSTLRRGRTGNGADSGFHLSGYFTAAVFLLFLLRAASMPSMTKRFAIPAIVL